MSTASSVGVFGVLNPKTLNEKGGGATGAAAFFAAPSSDNPPPRMFNTSAAEAGAWFLEASAGACAAGGYGETQLLDMTSIGLVPRGGERARV